MNPIKAAAWNFWYTLSNAETIATYRFAIAKTWQLLKQAAQLAVLLFLFGVTAAIWVWAVSFQSGRSLRVWLETEQPTVPEILSGGGDVMVRSLAPAWNWAQSQLKTQLGVEFKLPSMSEFKQLEPAQNSKTSAMVTDSSKK
jgi:hypothetical protein